MNIKSILNAYFTLPFWLQFGISFQYVLYITIAIYYSLLSLPNPLMLSTADVFHGSSVHPMSWVFVMLLAIYVRIKLPLFKQGFRNQYVAFIYNSLLVGILVTFAMGLVEFAWDISMTYWWWSNGQLVGLTILNYTLTYAFLLTGSAILVNVLLRNYKYFRHAWLIPVVIFGYQIIWLALGFPITSEPQYRNNLLVNGLELIGHWGLGIGIFGVLFVK